jgi:hypothetical protein
MRFGVWRFFYRHLQHAPKWLDSWMVKRVKRVKWMNGWMVKGLKFKSAEES